MRGITFSRPHPRGKRWGILRRGDALDSAHGTWITFETEEEAERERAKALRQIAKAQGGPTIAEVVAEYLETRRRKGRKERTIRILSDLLRGFWPDQTAPIGSVSPEDYAAMVRRKSGERRKYAAATHSQALIRAKAVLNYAVVQGYVKASPLAGLDPDFTDGKPIKGKHQLTQDEGALWLAEAERQALAGDDTAIAAMMLLLLQLRCSEACGPMVRDLDAGGTVLHILGKGDRRRRIRLTSADPEADAGLAVLRGLLADAARRAREAGRVAPLLLTNRLKVWRKVKAICAAAKVPEVCPHSLRGLGASMRVEAGEDPGSVAKGLGNSRRVLEGHYLAPGAVESGRIAQVLPMRRVTAPAAVVTSAKLGHVD